MKKRSLLKIAIFAIFTIMFSGCVGVSSSNVSLQNDDKLYLSKGVPLAYAYMENGTKLAYIKFNYEEPKDGFEVINISNNGFYPNYSMDSNVESGSNSPGCLVVMKNTDKNYQFCTSNYTRRTMLSAGTSAIWNAGATFTTVGLNVATGAIADPKFFDKDKFLQIVKDNNLIQIRTKISEIINLQNIHNNELTSLYNAELNKYTTNIDNISFDYIYVDESGLLFDKKLNCNIKIIPTPPDKNLNSYMKQIEDKQFTSLNDFTNFGDNLIARLVNDFQNTKNTYINNHLNKNFKQYNISTNSDKYFRLNKNIAFNGEIILPKNVEYEYGKKKTVPVKLIIKSANIENIAPQKFILSDNNINVSFNNQSGSYIDAIMLNNTNSFLTVKSLTSYVDGDNYTFSNIVNRELAPASRTLESNSRYAIFNNTMSNKLSLNNVTKSTLSSKKIDYGFAIKYHIQDSNLEKTIFKKIDYTYLELYKNYL